MKAAGNSSGSASGKPSAHSWWSKWLKKIQSSDKPQANHISYDSIKSSETNSVNFAHLQETLQNVYIEQRYEAIHDALKGLLNALQANLFFGPPDNIYVGMYLIKEQQESMRLIEQMLHAPTSIVKHVDELFSHLDLLTSELPDDWCDKVTPFMNDFQMLLLLPEHHVEKEVEASQSVV